MKDSSNDIERAMHALDGIQRAEAPPYFTARVMERVSAVPGRWEMAARFITRPLVWAACLVFILMLNAFLFFGNNRSGAIPEESTYELFSLTDYRTFETETLEP